MPEPLWGPEELSECLGVPVATLYGWNHRGVGPPAREIGRHLRYRPEEVEPWLEEQRSNAATCIVSVEVLTTCWKHSRARGTDLLVLLALADIANDEGECWPSIFHLAKKCRIDERTTQRRIRSLEGLGEVVVVRCGGRASRHGEVRSNRYRITVYIPEDSGGSPPRESATGGTGATQTPAPVPPMTLALVPPEPSVRSVREPSRARRLRRRFRGGLGRVPATGRSRKSPEGVRSSATRWRERQRSHDGHPELRTVGCRPRAAIRQARSDVLRPGRAVRRLVQGIPSGGSLPTEVDPGKSMATVDAVLSQLPSSWIGRDRDRRRSSSR